VNVSTAHVYVYLDQYYQSGTTSALARVPIAGGEAEVVQMGAEPRTFGGSICEHACFAASGGRGFWSKGGAVFVIDPDPGAQPIEIVPAMDVGELSLDDTHLYFSTFVELRRVPLAGGPSEFVTVLPLDGAESLFMHPRVGPDFIYAVESVENVDPEKHYLATIPKVDAPWTRIANLPSGTSKLQIIGGGYFLDTFAGSNGNTSQITHASLSEPMNQTNLVAVPTETKFIWTGSRVGAFWSEGRNIYFRATNSD
jgi:hypothetical protein